MPERRSGPSPPQPLPPPPLQLTTQLPLFLPLSPETRGLFEVLLHSQEYKHLFPHFMGYMLISSTEWTIKGMLLPLMPPLKIWRMMSKGEKRTSKRICGQQRLKVRRICKMTI